MALKDQKPAMFSTWFDIVNLAQLIVTEKADLSDRPSVIADVVRYKSQLEEGIIMVDALIWSRLRAYYTLDTLKGLDTEARVTVPVPDPRNTGDSELISVLLNSVTVTDISTAAWFLNFTNATTYDIFSSLEATQGTGWVTSDATKTSTNTEVTIETGFWVANSVDFDKGDRFYFSVIRAHELIHFISNLLATGHALCSIFTSTTPNESAFGKKLWERGMKLLETLYDEAGTAHLDDDSGSSFDRTSISIDYEINELGLDASPYLLDASGQQRFPTADNNPDIG